ncbi:MAG: hypothetical protein ACKVRP_15980 [Bacteroidota bacterium]
MKTFQVFLTRDYVVDVVANNREEAAACAEFFVSGGVDSSTEEEQEHYSFKIQRIKPVVNEAFEIHEIVNDGN